MGRNDQAAGESQSEAFGGFDHSIEERMIMTRTQRSLTESTFEAHLQFQPAHTPVIPCVFLLNQAPLCSCPLII